MNDSGEVTLYDLLGEAGIDKLVADFYRAIPDDPLLGPMYPAHDLEGAAERLKLFLLYRLGGPPTYLEVRGHPALRRRHAPFRVDQAARDRWVQLMDSALDQTTLDDEPREALRQFFHQTASFLMNSHG